MLTQRSALRAPRLFVILAVLLVAATASAGCTKKTSSTSSSNTTINNAGGTGGTGTGSGAGSGGVTDRSSFGPNDPGLTLDIIDQAGVLKATHAGAGADWWAYDVNGNVPNDDGNEVTVVVKVNGQTVLQSRLSGSWHAIADRSIPIKAGDLLSFCSLTSTSGSGQVQVRYLAEGSPPVGYWAVDPDGWIIPLC